MRIYTPTKARQKLASLLEQAAELAVEGIDLGLSREEILQSIEEGRREIE